MLFHSENAWHPSLFSCFSLTNLLLIKSDWGVTMTTNWIEKIIWLSITPKGQNIVEEIRKWMKLISIMYFCSLFIRRKKWPWNLKNLLTTLLKSRILLECTLVSELKGTFLPGRKIGRSAFFHCFLTDILESKPTVHLKPMSPPHCHLTKHCHPLTFSLPILIGLREKTGERTSILLLSKN